MVGVRLVLFSVLVRWVGVEMKPVARNDARRAEVQSESARRRSKDALSLSSLCRSALLLIQRAWLAFTLAISWRVLPNTRET